MGSIVTRPRLNPAAAAAAAKLLQSYPTLCDPIDGSSPGFPVPGILQARTLEWVGSILLLPFTMFLTLGNNCLKFSKTQAIYL